MPIDWINYVDQKLAANSYDYDNFFRYLSMLYYGVLYLGANEMGPVSPAEMFHATAILIISSLMNAILFGDIASLMNARNRLSVERQRRLDEANNVMLAIELEEDN